MQQTARIIILISLCFFLYSCGSDDEDGTVDGDEDKVENDEEAIDLDGDQDSEAEQSPDGDEDGAESADDSEIDEESLAPLDFEAGFIEIEPVTFSLNKGSYSQSYTSNTARLWYAFQPADESPETKPLLIFFNGGPGSSTAILFGFNTAKMTWDRAHNGGLPVGPDPHSWTRIGNLLYVDARMTGFSYGLLNDPSDESARNEAFGAQNFNPLIDGADFVRVLLRFLAAHPQIQKNPVIIVGESYGGIRSTVMLNLLLHYPRFALQTSLYQDQALVEEIQAHVDTVFPDHAGEAVGPEIIASQFTHQVLIQPLLTGVYQDSIAGEMWEEPGSPMYQMATEEGVSYVPCSEQADPDCKPHDNGMMFVYSEAQRDFYNYSQPASWMDDEIARGIGAIVTTELLTASLITDARDITQLYADQRQNAYRMVSLEDKPHRMNDDRIPLVDRLRMARRFAFKDMLDDAGDLPVTFGELQPWDAYYMSLNDLVNITFYVNGALAFEIDPFQPVYGDLFLEDVVHVPTFITNAAYDLVIYAPALPPALAKHSEHISEVIHDTEAREGIARPGWIHLTYQADAFDGMDNNTRTIRFPIYAESCHAVEMTEPAEFLEDVVSWLEEN